MFDLLSWATKFIATPSVSRDGNQAMAELAAEMLRRVGLTPELHPAQHDGQTHYNLIADIPARSSTSESVPPGLILLTHLDTVPPGDAAEWTATGLDPFAPTQVADRLYGLGSADAKVDLVCKAAALAEIDLERLERPIRVVGTFAEEIGLIGARHFVRSGGTDGFAFAMVGEPSELTGIRAHKGYAVFEAEVRLDPLAESASSSHPVAWEVRGRSAHSSTPHLGASAIDAALRRLADRDVTGLFDIEGGGAVNVVAGRCLLVVQSESGPAPGPEDRGGIRFVPLDAPRPQASVVYDARPLVAFYDAWCERLEALARVVDGDFDPAFTVGNLGRIELLEGRARIRFDLRPVPGVDLDEAVRPLEAYAKIQLVRRNPALATPADGVLVSAVREAQRRAGIEPCIKTKATCTEAGLLAESGGLEVVVLGAGISVGNVHRPNEYTLVPQLMQARSLYRELISILCIERTSIADWDSGGGR